MVDRRRSRRAADSRSGPASVDVSHRGTEWGSCGSRLSVGWTDNLGSCPNRWCCSRSASVRDHSVPEVSHRCVAGCVP